jgi:hypothetical protein
LNSRPFLPVVTGGGQLARLLCAVAAGGSVDAEISAELSPAPAESHGLTEPEIDVEVESYRQELEIEKSIGTSSASRDGEKTG